MEEKALKAIQKNIKDSTAKLAELKEDIRKAEAAGIKVETSKQEARDLEQRIRKMVAVYGT